MRMRMIGLTLCLMVAGATGFADEPKKEKQAPVREIDLKGAKLPQVPDGATKPTAINITSLEELKKVFPDEELQVRLQKEVDFDKQQLLFFAWSGSGGDQLSFMEKKSEKGLAVVYSYQPGRTKDLRSHYHLYVLAKDTKWSLGKP